MKMPMGLNQMPIQMRRGQKVISGLSAVQLVIKFINWYLGTELQLKLPEKFYNLHNSLFDVCRRAWPHAATNFVLKVKA